MKDFKKELMVMISEVCTIELEQLNDETLIEDIGINSVTFVELLARVEQDFKLEFSVQDYDYTRLGTLADLWDFIAEKLKLPGKDKES